MAPSSEEDRKAKSFLCSKYLETFTHLKERVKNFADLSIELLVGMREMLLTDPKVLNGCFWIFLIYMEQCIFFISNFKWLAFFVFQYYQKLFREGECFLHVVSLLNGNLDAENGEKLVLNVIQTLTSLLSQNDDSKVPSLISRRISHSGD